MIYLAFIFYMVNSEGSLGFIDRMLYGEWGGKPGDKFTQTLNLLAIVSSLLLFWWGIRRLPPPRFNRVLPLTAAGLFVASILWSVAPDLTTTRSIAYLFLVIGAIGVAEIFDANEVMRLIALIAGLSAAVSLLLRFALPSTVISPLTGDFRGLFSQKNPLGEAMMVGVLAGLHGMRIGKRKRLLYISVTVLCTVAAILSQSTTSLLIIFTFFTLHIIGNLYTKGSGRRLISFWLTIVSGLSFILLTMHRGLILGFLDKDATLTGRTDLWPYVIEAIFERPMFGWGFTAFWSPVNPRAEEISSAVGWGFPVVEAHNGLLELLLDVGMIGTAFFLFLWLRNLVIAVKCMRGPAPQVGVSSLLFLVGVLVMGVSEQVLLTAEGPTVMFFLLGFMSEKEVWLARHARSGVGLRSAAGLHAGPFGAPR
jgi:O-antigen ligase